MKRIFLASALSGDVCLFLDGRYRRAHPARHPVSRKKPCRAARIASSTSRPTMRARRWSGDRALARAAQLTLDKGQEWFEIASKIDGEEHADAGDRDGQGRDAGWRARSSTTRKRRSPRSRRRSARRRSARRYLTLSRNGRI